jgi:NAD(P)-dependent dehydrogenase (short-subunit alcohol dehydrogenase family)
MEETMDYGLQGKVALVTGTASQVGMGRAICLTLAKEGCEIVSTDIDLEGAKQTAAAVKVLGRKGIALKVDVAKSSEVDEIVKEALKKFGKIDILVNVAGGNFELINHFMESKQENWEINLAVNLYGTMNCAKAVIPSMVEHKYGKIINFSSISAKMGWASSYGAAKAAVLAFTRGLATQYGPSGINVNAIAPGVVETRFFLALGERANKLFEDMAASTPLGRNQTVEDMANAVAFLASDVSRNITGQCLQVDSGRIML